MLLEISQYLENYLIPYCSEVHCIALSLFAYPPFFAASPQPREQLDCFPRKVSVLIHKA